MKRILLFVVAMLTFVTSIQAAQTVRRYLRLSDNNLNLSYFGESNSRNLTANTLTLGDSWCAAGWNFESSPLDLTKYDKIVVKLDDITSDTYEVGEDGGSAAEFRMYDSDGYWTTTGNLYTHRIMQNEMEFEIPLGQSELYKDNDETLNLSHISIMVFWCYAPCTIHIKEIYLEKTLADGEKEFDTTPFPMTQSGVNYKSDGLEIDEADWTFPVYSFDSFAGWDWSTNPQDWSAYKYLVIVPQIPNNPSTAYTKPFQVHLSDGVYNFQNAQLRQFEWNNRRAMVIDLSNMGQYEDTDADGEEHQNLAKFNVKGVQALWVSTALGNANELDFGVSAIYLTNTLPTWDPWLNSHTTADFVISNDAVDQFYTVCLPYNSAVCGANAYSIKGVDKDAKKIVLQRENGILTAGTPYILRSNQGAADGLGNITFYRAGDSEVADGGDNGALKGVFLRHRFDETDAAKAVYDDENGKWVTAEEGSRASANGAYIDITKLAIVTATDNDVTMDIDADLSSAATGIEAIHSSKFIIQNSDAVYNLAGQRVGNDYKGIVIVNGKKVIRK